MRQVPAYLLIGGGKAARHLRHYFSLLSLPYTTWERTQSEAQLQTLMLGATHILLLISDQQIPLFIQQHLSHTEATLIHCSGSLVHEKAYGVHPLTTFNDELYTLERYLEISFILEQGAPALTELLPGVPNPYSYIASEQKAKYHALCVASGNFSCLLWQKLFSTFEQEFHLPKEAAFIYLQQQTDNLRNDYQHALTGPLVRGDQTTINNNLAALADGPLQKIYQAFVDYYQEEHAV